MTYLSVVHHKLTSCFLCAVCAGRLDSPHERCLQRSHEGRGVAAGERGEDGRYQQCELLLTSFHKLSHTLTLLAWMTRCARVRWSDYERACWLLTTQTMILAFELILLWAHTTSHNVTSHNHDDVHEKRGMHILPLTCLTLRPYLWT